MSFDRREKEMLVEAAHHYRRHACDPADVLHHLIFQFCTKITEKSEREAGG